MFKIKICGISSVKDAQLVGLAGADAVGLNFYEHSPRVIDLATAEKLVAVLRPHVKRVGLFVNAEAAAINQLVEALSLDYIQLHGDEPSEFLSQLSDRPIIRAFRFGEHGAAEIAQYLDDCSQHRRPDVLLIDASKPGEYGGTGEVADWAAVAAARGAWGGLPVVLAGGLSPFNVAEAIATVRPDAVDSASGVESKPGNKDPMLVRAFVNTAKKAFQDLAAESI